MTSLINTKYSIAWANNNFTITWTSGQTTTFADAVYVLSAYPGSSIYFLFGPSNAASSLLNWNLCTSPTGATMSDLFTAIEALDTGTSTTTGTFQTITSPAGDPLLIETGGTSEDLNIAPTSTVTNVTGTLAATSRLTAPEMYAPAYSDLALQCDDGYNIILDTQSTTNQIQMHGPVNAYNGVISATVQGAVGYAQLTLDTTDLNASFNGDISASKVSAPYVDGTTAVTTPSVTTGSTSTNLVLNTASTTSGAQLTLDAADTNATFNGQLTAASFVSSSGGSTVTSTSGTGTATASGLNGLTNPTYSWVQIGNVVTLWVQSSTTTTNTTATFITLTFPTSVPASSNTYYQFVEVESDSQVAYGMAQINNGSPLEIYVYAGNQNTMTFATTSGGTDGVYVFTTTYLS